MHRFKQIFYLKKYNIRHNRNICPKIEGKKKKNDCKIDDHNDCQNKVTTLEEKNWCQEQGENSGGTKLHLFFEARGQSV